jgi:hypothetical protein
MVHYKRVLRPNEFGKCSIPFVSEGVQGSAEGNVWNDILRRDGLSSAWDSYLAGA